MPQYSSADGSGNSVVDAADLTVWRQHFGNADNQGAGASMTVATTMSQPPAENRAAPSITPLEFGVSTQKPSFLGRMQGESALELTRSIALSSLAASPRELALLNLMDDYYGAPDLRNSSPSVELAKGVTRDRHDAFAGPAIEQMWGDVAITDILGPQHRAFATRKLRSL